MKLEELYILSMAAMANNAYSGKPNKNYIRTQPKTKAGKVFKSKNILGISPAEYRRNKLGKKG